MDAILKALNTGLNFVYSNILSIAMMFLLIAVGLFLTVRSRGFQFRRFGYVSKNTIGSLFKKNMHAKDKGSVSPFQAVTTALAGTIGTGSIAGVATALVAGGPGAIFWMWISALLGMVTKYSEIVLSLKYREKNEAGAWTGGPMYYIKNGLGIKWLAALFAVFAMIACIGTGNATQSNSIAGVFKNTFHVAPWITGIVLTLIVGVVILGGVKRIASVNEKLVPVMAVFFILASILALIFNASSIPTAFKLIFREAFNFKAAFGGVAGYGILTAMRYGVGRGVFSNEAGLGSAPIAHAASSTEDPVKQGLWGVFEVFITTIIICTMSALVVLTSEVYLEGFNLGGGYKFDGAPLSAAAFGEALPYVGSYVISIATVFFALSTILGWAYYGEVCATYLFKSQQKKAVLTYRLIYVAFVFIGAVAEIGIVWLIADCFNALMALPNLIALTALSKVVIDATKKHFENNKLNIK
ncbi:MAG: sodium:alanine symporter family protein [Ruminococcaceae bacterium]|nr:sodium:alanine symporter family protein [Oscillospiraceae bacterium]